MRGARPAKAGTPTAASRCLVALDSGFRVRTDPRIAVGSILFDALLIAIWPRIVGVPPLGG